MSASVARAAELRCDPAGGVPNPRLSGAEPARPAPTPRRIALCAALSAAAAGLAACGQKGALYLPSAPTATQAASAPAGR